MKLRSFQTQLLPGYGKVIQESMKYGPIGSMQTAYELLAKVQTAGGPAEVLIIHVSDPLNGHTMSTFDLLVQFTGH